MSRRLVQNKTRLNSALPPTNSRKVLYGLTAASGIGAAYWLSRPQNHSTGLSSIYRSSRLASSYNTMSTTPPDFKITPYTPPSAGLPPINPDDFKRMDEANDTYFYNDARLVTHIDENAINHLSLYYHTVIPYQDASLPAPGRAPIILDLCSSWVSHYPPRLQTQVEEGRLEVYGQGMNKAELVRNTAFTPNGYEGPNRWVVHDLNADPSLSKPLAAMNIDTSQRKISMSTLVVSIDYLTQPHAVLQSLREHTILGGSVHLAISNRCFPTKAVWRWMYAGEGDRLKMTCEDLWRAGWRNIEVVNVTDGTPLDKSPSGPVDRGLQSFMNSIGAGAAGDPLWVVRGTNSPDSD